MTTQIQTATRQRLAGLAPDAGRRVVVSGFVTTEFTPPFAGDCRLMSWIDEADLPAEHVGLVRPIVDRAANVLGVGPITIRWYAPSKGPVGDFSVMTEVDGELAAGCTPPEDYARNTIGINALMRGDQILEVVAAHEVRHVWQSQMKRILLDAEACEADANAFAAAFLHDRLS